MMGGKEQERWTEDKEKKAHEYNNEVMPQMAEEVPQ